MSTIIRNRKAYHDYEIIEKYEAGIKLLGVEVKALKEGKGNLTGTYVKGTGGRLSLIGFNLPPYSKSGTLLDYDSTRTRLLLLTKKELDFLLDKTEKQGFTLIPLKFYTKGSLIKLEIGLAKGKKKSDKKRALMEAQEKRDIERDLKNQKR
ncbi:SsrA-binding protein [candidate division WWE3 bacterium CG_4_9_14_0_2_um_filter_35_11]|uniref:SsrA-binding protein n=1 Tax=candidate division WWE3 bacterium CG_4_9_14_0_2_um_filter_35_11 TaxID=1975077 RepID=A0A2M8ELD3_UNCKA|nr:MAG: SsrA-binding protein [candidate division WWE3 bacterium CG10_big_fil_rev_8_21_14_0_10_35_32]PJC23520.1 MAG: SsrA-binding protein [candidate division WWE3 bacterium CG_4_9_14_0_2_um_filter_35_11]